MSNNDIINEWFKAKKELKVFYSEKKQLLNTLNQKRYELISDFLSDNDVKNINLVLNSYNYLSNEKRIKQLEIIVAEIYKASELALDNEEVLYWLASDTIIVDNDVTKREEALKLILNELNTYISINIYQEKKELLQGSKRRNDFIESRLNQLKNTYNIFVNDFGILENLGSMSSAFMNNDLRVFISTYKNIINELENYKLNNIKISKKKKDYKFINQFVWNTSTNYIPSENIKKIIELHLKAINLNYKKTELFYNINELIKKHYENKS